MGSYRRALCGLGTQLGCFLQKSPPHKLTHTTHQATQCQVKGVNVSPSMLARPVARWAMPAGSFTALSTASSLTAPCPLTRLLEVETTLSTPSSQRPVPANMSPVLSSLTWNPQLLMK